MSSETMKERDIPPGIGALDFIEESSHETKAIWHQYRTFRRGVITLEALETQLGATLLELSEDSTGTTQDQVEIVFLTQYLRALQEASEQALNSVIAIENGTPAPLLELIEQAIERGRNRLNEGAPSFLAGAWYHRLANQISWYDPEQAAAFGTFVTPTKPQAIIVCLFGAPGIAICVVAALIAISSHNVETDDDGGDTDGGDTDADDDGGTTGE